MAPVPSLRVGQTVGGKYRLLRESKRSGDLGGVVQAASVFEAEHIWTGKRFTLKVLAAHAESSLEMRFVREARAASALVHPNVVKVYDVDRDANGALYQVQELLEGETLAEMLRREKKLGVDAALDLLLPIMDALTLAHDVGVVHRDVRPPTIFFAKRHDGVVVPKLIDFGVSKLVGASSGGGSLEHALTVNNGSIETVAYMSPERLTSLQIDASVDVWAMGVTLYETLAGTVPFPTKSFADMTVQIATRDAPHLWERAPDVPPELAAIVDRTIARKREGRIVEMMVLVAELCAAAKRELPEKSESLMDALASVQVDTDGLPTPVALEVLAPKGAQARRSRPPTLARSTGETRVARVRLGVVGDPDSPIGASTEDRLDRALMMRTAVVRMPTYADLVDALAENRVDVAWLAPMAYAHARGRGAIGLFEVARSGPRDPRALLIGRPPTVRSFDDIRGVRAAWVDPWSTSGYALQRRALLDHGIDASAFSAQAFLGTHDAVGIAIATGRADVGGIVGVLDKERNEISGPWPEDAEVVILAMSDPLPAEVIAVAPSLANEVDGLKRALAEAGVPALAGLVGAEIAGELRPVNDARYATLLDS